MEYKKAIDHALRILQNELPDNLRYHSMEHTLAVLHSAEYLAKKEGLSDKEIEILLTAAAYHDSGFTVAYKDHEQIGCEIAAQALPQFGYSKDEIEMVKQLILSTKIPQSPSSIIEKVLCDADLDYLGGDNYGEISDSLRDELGLNGIVLDSDEWLNIQIRFLENHHYWTDFALKVLKPRKELVLSRLRKEAAAKN